MWKNLVSLVVWPSGLRRWFKAPVISMAWVRIPPLPVLFCFTFCILLCCSFVDFSIFFVCKSSLDWRSFNFDSFSLQKLIILKSNCYTLYHTHLSAALRLERASKSSDCFCWSVTCNSFICKQKFKLIYSFILQFLYFVIASKLSSPFPSIIYV